MKSDAFFRMPTICANVEMNSSVLWNEIWSSFCAQKDIVPCRNCMEKYRIQSMHWKRKKFYQMRKHKSWITWKRNALKLPIQWIRWESLIRWHGIFVEPKWWNWKKSITFKASLLFPVQKIFGLQLKRYYIRAEESYISKSAVIFRRFGQSNPHEGLSLILLSQGWLLSMERLQFPVNIKQRICGFGMKKKQFLHIWQNQNYRMLMRWIRCQKELLRIPTDRVLLPSSVKRFADGFASMYI